MERSACRNKYKLSIIWYVLAAVVGIQNNIILVNGTISIISDGSNETVFATEEAGIDTASAFGLQGRLVIAEPLDACETVNPPPINTTLPEPHKWILIATLAFTEDSCSLSRKAKNAQFAGYSGIVLRRVGSNDTDGVIPRFIGFDWIGVKIYTCVVGDYMGAFLMEKYTYPNRYYASFENEPYFSISLLGNFLIIGVLGIAVVLLLIRLFQYLYFGVTTRVYERRRIRKSLLSATQLKKLPVLLWAVGIPQDTCSICIDLFEEGEEIRVLPCSHVFHKVCIDPWLLKESRKCPNCKGRVIFPNERFSDTSASENSDSGDERTPLLRRRSQEDHRFIDGLTESHNTRAIQPILQTYQPPPLSNSTPNSDNNSAPGTSKASHPTSDSPKTSAKRNRTPRVTFSSGTTGGSEGFRTVANSNAFVFPRSSTSSGSSISTNTNSKLHKSPGKKNKLVVINNPPQVPPAINVVENDDDEMLCSSISSEETLMEFQDVAEAAEDNQDKKSFTESMESKSSFHSCQDLQSDASQNNELYYSFSSQNS